MPLSTENQKKKQSILLTILTILRFRYNTITINIYNRHGSRNCPDYDSVLVRFRFRPEYNWEY